MDGYWKINLAKVFFTFRLLSLERAQNDLAIQKKVIVYYGLSNLCITTNNIQNHRSIYSFPMYKYDRADLGRDFSIILYSLHVQKPSAF